MFQGLKDYAGKWGGCRKHHFLVRWPSESAAFFDDHREYKGLQVGMVSSLFKEVRDAVLEEEIPLEKALQIITSNPAQVLKLHQKGGLQKGKDADVVLLEKDTLQINTVSFPK